MIASMECRDDKATERAFSPFRSLEKWVRGVKVVETEGVHLWVGALSEKSGRAAATRFK